MTAKKAKVSASPTHDGVGDVKVEKGDTKLTNAQKGMMLIDPEDLESGSTHSDKKVTASKLRASDTLIDDEDDTGGSTHSDIMDDLPVIDNTVEADLGDDFVEDELSLASAEDDEDTFGDLAADVDDGDDADSEFDDMESLDSVLFEDAVAPDQDAAIDEGEDLDVMADFEAVEETTDDVPLVDIDGVDDEAADDVVFASVGNSLHVLRSNRIIASMGPAAAKRADVQDVYHLDQFQDVVASAIAKKGLRKGLVQSGFVLAKVRMTSAKANAKAIKAGVEKQVAQRLEALAARDNVLEQSLAIAATGINKQFFKDTQNELRANLEVELEQLGVRGASRLVRAMFAKHGVSYAKAILTTAKKIAAMPEQTREHLIAALDMTDGGTEDDEVEVSEELEDDEDDMAPIAATSVVAALSNPRPVRQQAALLRATNGSSAATAILSGTQSLV